MNIKEACEILNKSLPVALPTETVYGLAANAYCDLAVQKIYQLKQRPLKNPLIIHYADQEKIKEDVFFNKTAEKLAQLFWPGPLTLVLKKKPQSRLSLYATAFQDSVAIRMPSHPVFQHVLAALDYPLAAPSANPSGKLSPTSAKHVRDFFDGCVPVLDAGVCEIGIESTIVDCTSDHLKILRPGILDPFLYADFIKSCESSVMMPGMMKSHYAPEKKVRLDITSLKEDEGLLAFGPFPKDWRPSFVFQLSSKQDLKEAARSLFEGLYQLDRSSCTSIAVMPIPAIGLGIAINDRLEKASYRAV